MSTVQTPDTILLNLDANNANRLMLEPALGYENVLQNQLNLYQIEIGKDKVTMNHLSKPQNVLQPKSNCKTWNPTVRFGLEPDEIVVSDYEVNGEQCSDEWEKACARNLLGLQEDSMYQRNSPQLEPLQNAMIQTLSQSIVDSSYKVAWFSDKNYAAAGYEYEAYVTEQKLKNNGMTGEQVTNLTSMLRVQNGIWRQVYDYVDSGQMQYVDSNDGTAGGNALNVANIEGYLQDLKRNADQVLKFWNYGPSNSMLDRPFYAVQYGLFQTYLDMLKANGTEESHRLKVEGITIPGVYEFDGHLIFAVPEWTMFDAENGMIHPTTGYSRIQRALFMAPRNITILANVKTLQGFGQSGLIIEQSTQVRDKGVKWMYYTLGLGMSFAHEKLMVAGYNSELNTFA